MVDFNISLTSVQKSRQKKINKETELKIYISPYRLDRYIEHFIHKHQNTHYSQVYLEYSPG